MTWLTVRQVAAYLQISVEAVYKLAQRGRIPAHKVMSLWRFNLTEIDKWILNERTFYKSKEARKNEIQNP